MKDLKHINENMTDTEIVGILAEEIMNAGIEHEWGNIFTTRVKAYDELNEEQVGVEIRFRLHKGYTNIAGDDVNETFVNDLLYFATNLCGVISQILFTYKKH